jgi:catalase
MLLGRSFAYSDAQRNRIGTNFHQLPINRPKDGVEVDSYLFDGQMNFTQGDARPVYAPNSAGRPWADGEARPEETWSVDPELVRSAYALHAEDDDFGQPGTMVREVWNDAQRAAAIDQISGALSGGLRPDVLERAFEYWKNVDADFGKRIEETVRGGLSTEPVPGMSEA